MRGSDSSTLPGPGRARPEAEAAVTMERSGEDVHLMELFEAMHEAVILFDHDGRFLYTNPATERMHGVAREELAGCVIWERYPAAVGGAFHAAFERVRTSGAAAAVEFCYEPWERWFHTKVYALGQRIAVIATDITERKRAETRMAILVDDNVRALAAERAARAHAERVAEYTRSLQAMTSHLSRRLPAVEVAETILRESTALLGGTSAAIWLLARDGDARDQLEMLAGVGYPGGPETPFRRLALDADAPLPDAVRSHREVWLRDVSEYGRVYPRSLARVLSGGGGEFATACLPLAAEGHVIGGLALALPHAHDFDEDERTFLRMLADQCAQALDRTRLLEQERVATAALAETNRTLNAIISASPAAIMLVDLDGTVRLWNPAAERIFGWSAEDACGRFMPSISEDVREEFLANLARIASGQPIVGMETRRCTRDRGMIDVGIWAAPIQRPDGLMQALCVTVDITDRKQAEQAARAADRRKDEFLAMLGHELRNPLAPILTALQLMEMRGEQGAQRERAIIERQARHLVRLVDDLLDVSRITRGKIELERAPTDLAAVIAKAVEMASPLLERRSHRLELEVQPDLIVDGDPVRLAQVFQNLLTNAAKYTPPGGHIAARARRDGEHTVVEVHDDGIGIPGHLLGSVFEPFVQGERARDRSEGGLGIGLMLVRSLVELHGGSVTARSEGAGKGSCFEVRLPLLPVTATARGGTGPQPMLGRSDVRGCRVLLVDDNADAAEMLALVLRAVGHEVLVVHDGPGALAAAGAFAPEVALLDIGLPVMDGYELARHLSARLPVAPLFVALTGYGQEHDRQRSLEAGFADHLVKPVDPAQLMDVMSRIQASRCA
jgi:PAS domain S-box-containing protein